MRKTEFLIIIIFLAIVINTLRAKDESDSTDSVGYIIKNQVVVSATRYERKTIELPYSVSKIKLDGDEESNNTPDLLKTTTGSFVQKTNLGGGSAFIRGVTGNQCLIMIDGIRFNNSTFRYGPNQYLNTISQSSIQNIELLRGSGSVQYGSDAIGGVIYIQTKKPNYSDNGFKSDGFVQGRYMTSDIEKTINGEVNLALEKTAFLANFNYSDFGDLPGGGNIGIQSPSGYAQNGVDLKFRTAIIKNLDIMLNFNFLNQKDVPVYHKVKLENYEFNKMARQARNLSYISMEYNIDETFLKRINIKAGNSYSNEIRSRKTNGKIIQTDENDRINTFFGILDFITFLSNEISLNYGGEIYFDKVNSKREDIDLTNNYLKESRGLYPDNSEYLNSAFYLLSNFKIDRMIFDLGLRYNTFKINVPDNILGMVEINPSAFVYNAGVLFRINEKNSVYGSVNTAFRAPNIDDMGTIGIVDFRYEIPSNNLKPEKSINYEIGYKLSEDFFQGSVSIFHSNLSDFITRVKTKYNGQDSINGYQVYTKENVANSVVYGAEFDFMINFNKFLIQGNATYTYGQNLTSNEPMRRIPPLFGSLELIYNLDRNFTICLQNLFAGRQDRLASGDKSDNRINPNGTPGWYVMNLTAKFLLQSFKISAGINNIFNAAYRYHGSGIDAVGRSGLISVMYFFSFN
jgi:outer membrane receptor for ferrienterochelin and colicin